MVLFRSTETKLCDTLTVIQEAWVDPAPELTALTALYESTGGDGWTHNDNWCSDKPLNEWYGVETDEEGYVISLKLAVTICRELCRSKWPTCRAFHISTLAVMRWEEIFPNGRQWAKYGT